MKCRLSLTILFDLILPWHTFCVYVPWLHLLRLHVNQYHYTKKAFTSVVREESPLTPGTGDGSCGGEFVAPLKQLAVT